MDTEARATVGSSPVVHPEDRFFTVVAIPDTQVYSASHPEPFEAQTRWIADARGAEQIEMVFHEGDLVGGPDAPDEHFERADAALSTLDSADVPYLMTIGNHDYDIVEERVATKLESAFPVTRFDHRSWWVETYDEVVYNAAASFEVLNEEWLALALELFPRDEVLDWARDVLTTHPDHRTMVVTHGYLHTDGTRVSEATTWPRQNYVSEGHNGDELWDALIADESQIELVVSGHALIHGNAYLQAPNTDGTKVHQLLANYQSANDGGNGYLTLLRIYPSANVFTVETYSPSLKQFHPDPRLHFRIDDAFGDARGRTCGWFTSYRGLPEN